MPRHFELPHGQSRLLSRGTRAHPDLLVVGQTRETLSEHVRRPTGYVESARVDRFPLIIDRLGLIAPIEPFRTGNRFTTATVFGILAFEVLKIFEELLFSSADPLNHGVLFELIERIAIVILVG